MSTQPPEACSLADRECVPCKGGVPPLAGDALAALVAQLGGGWKVIDGRRIEKLFKFKDFAEALAFTNQLGALAEQVGHHPDILLSWGKVKLTLWTHKIGGLSEADFIFAAKADRLSSVRSS
jgi:4a-hydroxytetrahydrobiopterin dehydratase